MSRCRCCGNSFEEENGWQEYCSLACAMKDIIGKVIVVDDVCFGHSKECKRWLEWFGNPKNNRLVRRGEPAEKPKCGGKAYRILETVIDGKKVKVKHDIKMEVVPMSERDRKNIKRYRGTGFSDGHVNNVANDYIPSEQGMKRVGEGWFPHD